MGIRPNLKARRWFAWFAAIAMLFATLAPAVSQAVSINQVLKDGLTPICTHAGLKWVDVATGEVRESPPDAGGAGHLERCPFCLTSPPGLPTTHANVTFAQPVFPGESPYLFEHAPRTLFVWSRANPRAPPARA
jgi:hypothetical protein